MSQFTQPVAQGIRFILSIVTAFAQYPFPGTDIPILAIGVGAWAIYFFWRWLLAQIFDMETKK